VTDRTNDTCTPNARCKLQHSIQINTPLFTEAHAGRGLLQSIQYILCFKLISSLSVLACNERATGDGVDGGDGTDRTDDMVVQ